MKLPLLTCTLLALGLPGLHAAPAGFGEPPLILYGRVLAKTGQAPVQIYEGSLQWTLTTSTRQSLILSGSLQRLGSGAYSYRLDVPLEKLLPAPFASSKDRLPVSEAPLSLTASAILDGSEVALLLSSGGAHPGSFLIDEKQRGRIERIDLTTEDQVPFQDTDGDGIPDEWERRFVPMANPFDSSDAFADLDGDGLTNIEEYEMGLDPTCCEYARWAIKWSLTTPELADTNADPDGDGLPNIMEYALGGDPRTPDAPSVMAQVATSIEADEQGHRLTMTVTRPSTSHCNAEYVIESSSDLNQWSSSPADVITAINQSTILKAKSAKLIGNADGRSCFLNLRVIYKP